MTPKSEETDTARVELGETYAKTATIRAKQWWQDGDHSAVVRKSAPNHYADEGIPWCPTLEGGHIVTPGDWIATGINGEHWPIKPDVFAKTYRLAQASPEKVGAVVDVAAERQRQRSVEGWTDEHDDEHIDGSIAIAAATYAIGSAVPNIERGIMDDFGSSGTSYSVHSLWPWADEWFKPKGRRADLVKAGALILAEIERIDRMENKHA